MKFFVKLISITITLTLFWAAPNLSAGSLKDDYRETVVKRQALEKQRHQYEAKLKLLVSQRQKLNLELYQCVSNNWQEVWETKLKEARELSDKLEVERLNLVNLRIELDNIRQKYETQRGDIEEKYKNKRRGTAYENEFRQYMNDLKAEYFEQIETRLFAGYQKYLSGIDSYLLFLGDALNSCRGMGKTN